MSLPRDLSPAGGVHAGTLIAFGIAAEMSAHHERATAWVRVLRERVLVRHWL